MGRPPVKHRRDAMLHFRVTLAEARAIRKAAKAAGMNLTAYLLSLCRKGR
jgi:uncharacterized protein (DUF1778 family)